MSNFLITNLLIFIPLVGSLTIGIFKNKLSEKSVTFLAIFSVFISTVFSVWLLIQTFFYDYYKNENLFVCLLYTSPSPRDATLSRMPSSA